MDLRWVEPGRVHLWVKLLACQLEQADIVEFANIRTTSVQAAYKDGRRDIFYFKVWKRRKKGPNCFIVCPKSAAIRREIHIYKEFRDDPLDESETYHWCINRHQYQAGTLVEQRLVMHRLLRELVNAQFKPDCYPEYVLEEDWQKVQEGLIWKYLINGSITCFPGGYRSPHYRILEHFFNPSYDLNKVSLWFGVRAACKRLKTKINSFNVRKLARHYVHRRIISPLAYCALFRSLNITGAVADLHPGYGSKALACAMMGLPYYTVKDDRFQRALDLGFSSLTRADFDWFDGQEVELLISDDNLRSFQMPSSDLLSKAKKMFCYVPREAKQELIDKYHPVNVIQIHSRAGKALMLKDPDYLFIW